MVHLLSSHNWESRCSRKGETYYYNRVTHECTWTLPGRKPSIVPNRSHTSRPNFSRAGELEIEENSHLMQMDSHLKIGTGTQLCFYRNPWFGHLDKRRTIRQVPISSLKKGSLSAK